MKKAFYSYETLKGDLNELTRQMAEVEWKPSVILGISRGGVIPALMLSEWFNVPFYSYQCSLRDHVDAIPDIGVINILKQKNNVLVVDDICDSGETLRKIKEYLPDATYAVLHLNIGQKVFTPRFSVNEFNKNDVDIWIDYEWERWWKAN